MKRYGTTQATHRNDCVEMVAGVEPAQKTHGNTIDDDAADTGRIHFFDGTRDSVGILVDSSVRVSQQTRGE